MCQITKTVGTAPSEPEREIPELHARLLQIVNCFATIFLRCCAVLRCCAAKHPFWTQFAWEVPNAIYKLTSDRDEIVTNKIADCSDCEGSSPTLDVFGGHGVHYCRCTAPIELPPAAAEHWQWRFVLMPENLFVLFYGRFVL